MTNNKNAAVVNVATRVPKRVRDFLAPGALSAGPWRLTFATGAYFRSHDVRTFLPEVAVTFEVFDAEQHHHVPLLLSPFGYSAYRGN